MHPNNFREAILALGFDPEKDTIPKTLAVRMARVSRGLARIEGNGSLIAPVSLSREMVALIVSLWKRDLMNNGLPSSVEDCKYRHWFQGNESEEWLG